MNQTSLSWLLEMLSENGFLDLRCDNNEAQQKGAELQRIIDTAISMEKKQILHAYSQGCHECHSKNIEEFAKMYYYQIYIAGDI